MCIYLQSHEILMHNRILLWNRGKTSKKAVLRVNFGSTFRNVRLSDRWIGKFKMNYLLHDHSFWADDAASYIILDWWCLQQIFPVKKNWEHISTRAKVLTPEDLIFFELECNLMNLDTNIIILYHEWDDFWIVFNLWMFYN